MSKPAGNQPLNIRNLAYFQSLGSGAKIDPVRLAEALDDISTAYAQLHSMVTAATATPAVAPAPATTGGKA